MRAISFGLISLVFLVACGSSPTVVGNGPDLLQLDADCSANPAACGGCLTDEHCADKADTPRCDVSVHQCVTCLPQPDNCPAGQVCQQVNKVWACVTSCIANNDCNKLGGGSVCCSMHCVNLVTDVTNCGSCGNVCQAVNNGSPGCASGNCVVSSCNPGYDDCDKSPVNGCETNVSSDPLNCGKCGNVCKPFANGLPTCANNTCAAVCAPGYAECDGNVVNGCEVDTTYDIKNCGGCGRACAGGPNADPYCDSGKCGFRCKIGFSDCDGNPANGCETNANNDQNHCGHCGNICPLRPNSDAAVCQGGQCANTCKQGFGDCDNNPFNGCESDLNKSLTACGGCGKICSNNNAVATCAQGMCTIQCNPGFVDCNKDNKDGCEANLLADPSNCGACGNVCPQNQPSCAKGVCASCGNDCWGATGCLTGGGRCVRFTCRPGNAGPSLCNGCFGWKDITYDMWMNQGYCSDIIARYRLSDGSATRCGGAAQCCGSQGACTGGDNAWHFFDTNGQQNYFVGPCLGCGNDVNCTYWNNIDNGAYTRITACIR